MAKNDTDHGKQFDKQMAEWTSNPRPQPQGNTAANILRSRGINVTMASKPTRGKDGKFK